MLSDATKEVLDKAVAAATSEGYALWGFIVSQDQTEFQPFGNTGEDVTDFIHNIKAAASVLEEGVSSPNHA